MSEKVQILDDRTHVLTRPNTYIGSISTDTAEVYMNVDGEIRLSTVEDYNEGLLHIIKEVLDNACDNNNRTWSKPQSYIKVSMDNKSVTVVNDGKPIAVEEIDIDVPGQGKKTMYRTESIFDYFKSGTNFDNDEKCICKGNKRNPKCLQCQALGNAGMNGIGSKAALVFSKYAKIHHADPDSGKQLTLEFFDNHDTFKKDKNGKPIGRKNPPVVKSYKAKSSFTSFYFEPDFPRFGLKKFSKNHIAIVHAMCINISYITGLKVEFNDTSYKIKSLKDLATMYFGKRDTLEFTTENGDQVLCMAQTLSEMEEFGSRQLSFVNNTCTRNGGIHVRYNENIIGKVFSEWYGNELKPVDAKKFWIYVVVYNIKAKLTFTGQTKAELKGPTNIKKIDVDKKDFNKVKNWNLYTDIQIMLDGKTQRAANKGPKRGLAKGYLGGMGKKVVDANKAGDDDLSVRKSCTLYLSEGQSAMGFLTDSVDVDTNGCLALKGKVPNVYKNKKYLMNEEYNNIRLLLGLKMGCTYEKEEDIDTLRYGQVIIATDMDADGYHICALLNVFFWVQHPGLLVDRPGVGPFVKSLVTPVLKTLVGKTVHRFYTEEEYEQWYNELSDTQKSSADKNKKYFKGLGGNEPQEDGEYVFGSNFTTNTYTFAKQKDVNMIQTFFGGKDTDDKKAVILSTGYNPEYERVIQYGLKPFNKFICNDFMQTVLEHIRRAIPTVYDGLKESQKDIMYTAMMKMTDGKEIKTKQFATTVAQYTCYLHGEDNLPPTITGMTQDIIGTNNITYFKGKGSFGNRFTDGTNHGASAERYTYIKWQPLMSVIFNKADLPILEFEDRGGEKNITPKYLLPIIPTFLTSETHGMGNGWSIDSPAYNPLDLVEWVQTWIANNFRGESREYVDLVPWYRGYEGITEKTDSGWIFKAVIEEDGNTYHIKEIPVGVWGMQLKLALEAIADDGLIEKPVLKITHNNISATIKCKKNKTVDLESRLSKGASEKVAGKNKGYPIVFYNKFSMNNITFLHENGPFKTNDITLHLDEYCRRRYKGYCDRKKWILADLLSEIQMKRNKARYIEQINKREIILEQIADKPDLIEVLEGFKYDMYKDSYDYLLNLPTMSLLEKNIQRLNTEISKLVEEYDKLRSTKPWQIWLDELDVFLVEYDKYLKDNPVHYSTSGDKKGKKTKK